MFASSHPQAQFVILIYELFSGQYIPSNDAKYIHVPDMRQLGKYIHIPFPYNGGYGPYSGLNGIPYEYDPAGEYR